MTNVFYLGHDLDLEFSRLYMKITISRPKMVRLPRNQKGTHQLNVWPQMWPMGLTLAMTLTFDFQAQIFKQLYLSDGRADWCETKRSKSIGCWANNLTLTLTFDLTHGRSWIFKVKFWNSCILGMGRPIDIEQKDDSWSFMTMTVIFWWPEWGVWESIG